MSRTLFLKAADAHAEWRAKNNLPSLFYPDLFAELRDIWIEEQRYAELIAFINQEWPSGNCDDFMSPLADKLFESKAYRLYKQLWNNTLRHQLAALWKALDLLKRFSPETTLEDIETVDLTNYNLKTAIPHLTRTAYVAYIRKYTLNSLQTFKSKLEELGEDKEVNRLEALINQVTWLSKPKLLASSDKRQIDEALFWQLIAEARQAAQHSHDFIDKITQTLSAFKPKELINFQRYLLSFHSQLYTWDIWALAYIVRKGCSDDSFIDFRTWVIAQGETVFNSIRHLEEAKLLALFNEDPQLEAFMYVADNIYETRTGDMMPELKIKSIPLQGTQWQAKNLKQTHPKLCALFNFKD